MPKLVLMFKNMVLNTYPLTEGQGLTIGRHSENDIVIQNLAVSGRHARIDRRNGQIELTDLNSKNGTFLNGSAIHQCVLKDGDTIIIGKHSLRADWTDTMDVEPTPAASASGSVDLSRTIIMNSDPEARSGANTLAEAPETARPLRDCLLFLSGGKGECALSQRVTIGKNDDADIVVGGPMALLIGAPAVVISRQAGDYMLRFAGGWIKPRRNGKSVRGMVKLNHEDIVAIGPVRIQVQLSERPVA